MRNNLRRFPERREFKSKKFPSRTFKKSFEFFYFIFKGKNQTSFEYFLSQKMSDLAFQVFLSKHSA